MDLLQRQVDFYHNKDVTVRQYRVYLRGQQDLVQVLLGQLQIAAFDMLYLIGLQPFHPCHSKLPIVY